MILIYIWCWYYVELKLSLEADKLEDIKTKLDNLYMVLVLRGMHPDFDHIRDQVLTGQEVPSLENLITWLLRVPSPKIGGNSVDNIETSAMVSNRRGQGGGGNRGGQAGRGCHHQCSYCKRVGHHIHLNPHSKPVNVRPY